jgi:DtxR family Mn-dependent transcriptional regulator
MLMITNISPATQDYLKAIYDLTQESGRATTSQLSCSLNVKPASVTGMLQKMAKEDPPLVDYKKHKGVILTGEGQKAALEIMRHHRLIESFLHEILGYSWDEVHEEAERLEHVISEDMERRMAAVLGNPSRDPHGQRIPDQNLEILPDSDIPMNQLRPGQDATVCRVQDDDAELLRYLADLGLQPGANIKTLAYVPFDQTLRVQIGENKETAVLGPSITGEIFVELTA